MPEKPFYLAADYADDEIMLNPDGSVKAGTLSALVARLTTHEQLGMGDPLRSPYVDWWLTSLPSTDFTFTSTFLITYRSFATGPEVVDLLCKRYAISPPVALAPEQMNDWKLRKQTPVKLR
jgi:son of sevenless-like protein